MSDLGRIFRNAWIGGLKRHYPGDPKASYVASWEEISEWERASASAVAAQIREFADVSAGSTSRLTRSQKGRFVAICWIAQIFKHIPEPKQSYIADWDELPEWQRETDADIFEAIERSLAPLSGSTSSISRPA